MQKTFIDGPQPQDAWRSPVEHLRKYNAREEISLLQSNVEEDARGGEVLRE